jgi:diaminohydroxyphosphoribosylaminopyrimidine deaminase / 5-amino-6-(5-phosphoribosylamino)uracil reductase
MERAQVSDRVWMRLLRAGGNGAAEPLDQWNAAERAAWSLYAPIARARAPFFFAQVGQSLDGRVATISGDARDISGRDGLCHLHRCRALADAVVVGVRTAIQDDPRLTVRLVKGRSPARIVIDPKGRLPNTARVFAEDGARRIVVQATATPRPDGVEVMRLPAVDGWIDPAAIWRELISCGFSKVMIEGGGVTIARFLEAGLLDRLHVSVAPLIIGSGPTGLRTTPIAALSEALRPEMRVFGLETDVVFDCALDQVGSASTSTWPTVQEESPAIASARRA